MPSLQAQEQGPALASVPRPLAARSCRHRKDDAKRRTIPPPLADPVGICGSRTARGAFLSNPQRRLEARTSRGRTVLTPLRTFDRHLVKARKTQRSSWARRTGLRVRAGEGRGADGRPRDKLLFLPAAHSPSRREPVSAPESGFWFKHSVCSVTLAYKDVSRGVPYVIQGTSAKESQQSQQRLPAGPHTPDGIPRVRDGWPGRLLERGTPD